MRQWLDHADRAELSRPDPAALEPRGSPHHPQRGSRHSRPGPVSGRHGGFSRHRIPRVRRRVGPCRGRAAGLRLGDPPRSGALLAGLGGADGAPLLCVRALRFRPGLQLPLPGLSRGARAGGVFADPVRGRLAPAARARLGPTTAPAASAWSGSPGGRHDVRDRLADDAAAGPGPTLVASGGHRHRPGSRAGAPGARGRGRPAVPRSPAGRPARPRGLRDDRRSHAGRRRGRVRPPLLRAGARSADGRRVFPPHGDQRSLWNAGVPARR